jgi:hypothetical protein
MSAACACAAVLGDGGSNDQTVRLSAELRSSTQCCLLALCASSQRELPLRRVTDATCVLLVLVLLCLVMAVRTIRRCVFLLSFDRQRSAACLLCVLALRELPLRRVTDATCVLLVLVLLCLVMAVRTISRCVFLLSFDRQRSAACLHCVLALRELPLRRVTDATCMLLVLVLLCLVMAVRTIRLCVFLLSFDRQRSAACLLCVLALRESCRCAV